MIDRDTDEMMRRREKMYPDETFDGHLQEQVDMLSKMVKIDRPTVLVPLVTLHGDFRGRPITIPIGMTGVPDEPEDRCAVFRLLGRESAPLVCALFSVFFMAEAWAVRRELGAGSAGVDPESMDRPRDHPDRKSIVSIAGMTLDMRHNFAAVPVLSREGDPIKLGEPEVLKCSDESSVKSPLFLAFFAGYRDGLRTLKGARDVGESGSGPRGPAGQPSRG